MRIDDAQGAFRRLGVHWALLAGHTNATKVTLARVEGSWLWQRRRGTQRFSVSSGFSKGLSGNKRAISGISLRRDSVVPLAVEFGAFDIDGGHLGVRDDNAAGVLASVEFAAHSEAGFGGGGRD